MDNSDAKIDRGAPGAIGQSWAADYPDKRGGARQVRTALDNRIYELIDIVEAPGQKRDRAFLAFKAVVSTLQDLGDHAPHPLRVELMAWKAELFFRMTSKDYARPKAKADVLRAIRDLQ